MKKIIQSLFILSVFLVGCNEENQYEYVLERPEDTMYITSSNDTIILDENNKLEIAVTFNWNEAANRGEGTELTYYFKMDIANNSFKTSIPKIELEPTQRSISFTHEQINKYLTEYWKITPGGKANLEAEIIADVTQSAVYMKPELSITRIHIVSYEIPRMDLFLFGSAAGGLTTATEQKLEMLTTNKEYSWKGNLKAGEFKFLENPEELLPSYNKGENENTLIYRISEDETDNMFTVEEAGLHSIYLNLEEMEIIYTPLVYETVLMIGDATPAGWDINNPTPMTWNAVTPKVFTYEGRFNSGEIKFPVGKNTGWDKDFFMSEVPGNPIVNGELFNVIFATGGSIDNKWKFTTETEGYYKVTLDTEQMTIKFDKID